MPEMIYANIHHYFPHPDTGFVSIDEDGDPILGFYYQLLDDKDEPVSHLMGPYGAAIEAEEAAEKALLTGDY